MIDQPGIYDIPAHEYHADPCPEPSLSRSIAHLLVSRSPAHAFIAHPRLGGGEMPEPDSASQTRMDIGSAIHAVMLEGNWRRILRVGESDWRTKAARELRKDAHRRNEIPILDKDCDPIAEASLIMRDRVDQFPIDPPLFRCGDIERTLIWREDGLWLRARPDFIQSNRPSQPIGSSGAWIDDLKTTTNAEPGQWIQGQLWKKGYDLQVAMYRRGMQALTGKVPAVRFAVIERDPPYGLSVVSLAPSAMELAEVKLDEAIRLFRECLWSGEWPGYQREIAHAELPPWIEMRWLEKLGER